MIDATVLGGVVGEGAAGSSELVVESDAGGEREEPCCDPGSQVGWCSGAVVLEAQEVFEGEEDGFDPLPDRREMDACVGFVFAGWPDDQAAQLADGLFELAAGVALVTDDRLAAVERPREHRQRDLTFGTVSRDEGGGPGGAVGGAEQVQPQTPEPAGVALAVAVATDVSQRGAACRLNRAATLDRGRVQQHEIIVGTGALAATIPLNHSIVSASR